MLLHSQLYQIHPVTLIHVLHRQRNNVVLVPLLAVVVAYRPHHPSQCAPSIPQRLFSVDVQNTQRLLVATYSTVQHLMFGRCAGCHQQAAKVRFSRFLLSRNDCNTLFGQHLNAVDRKQRWRIFFVGDIKYLNLWQSLLERLDFFITKHSINY